MKTNDVGYIIGAYPCAPSFHQRSEEEEKDFWRQLPETPGVSRLEQPCPKNFHPLGDQWLLRHTPENQKFIVTAAMETIRRRSENGGLGLTSSDEEQRQAYIAYYRHLFNKIDSLQANRVLALKFQAVPLATDPNVMRVTDASIRSLKEIASWGWLCKLALEHCDTMTSSPLRKGFLSLENVLGVITDYDISICVNQARSAIEGRSTTLPLTHTQMVEQVGELDALMFSGTTPDGAYGGWQDLHVPFIPFCVESLMTTDHVLELLNVAGSSILHFAGIKLLEISVTADVHHRIEVLCSGIHSLNESR